jgi:hypothetical protein
MIKQQLPFNLLVTYYHGNHNLITIFIFVARLWNVCCRSESECNSKQWRFHYRRVPSSDKIPFLVRRLGKNMSVTLGDKGPFYSTVKNWVARFRTGHLRTKVKNVLGATPENVDASHFMILDDRRISSAKKDSREPGDIARKCTRL